MKIDSGRTLDQDSSPARSENLANSQDSTCVQLGKLVAGGPRILSYFRADVADVWILALACMTPTFIQFQLQPISDSESGYKSNCSIFQWAVSLVSPTRPCVDAMGTPGIDGEVPGGRRSPVDMDIYGPSLRTIFVSRSIKLIYYYSYVHIY